jgi:hypothetical protein
MRRLLIRMSFAADGEGGRTRTSGSGFGDRQCSHFAYTLIFKEQQKARPKPGLVRTAQNALRPSRHDSPNDPLRGHSDYVAFEGPKHCVDLPSLLSSFYCSTILERPAGFEPAYTSFVAKAIIPLWHGRINLVGELRIELRPRAPKARMQRITPFPDGASPAS